MGVRGVGRDQVVGSPGGRARLYVGCVVNVMAGPGKVLQLGMVRSHL